MVTSVPYILVSVLLLNAGGCVTTGSADFKAIPVSSDELIFPAVYQAVTQMDPDATLTATDFRGNRLTATNLRFKDGLTERRMDLRLTCDQGVLEYGERNEQLFDPRQNTWVDSGLYVFNSSKEIERSLNSAINTVLTNPALYASARAAALADLAFVHRGLEHLGAAGLASFVEHVLSVEPLHLSMVFEQERESRAQVAGATYTHELDGSTAAGDRFSLYANEDLGAQQVPGSTLTFTARIVEVSRLTDATFAFKAVSPAK